MRSMFRVTVLSACIGAMFSSVPAVAQTAKPGDTDASIPVIVVTAQKRKEKLQEIPLSVTALSPESLDALNVVSVNTLQNAIPNFLILNVGSMNTFTAYIRSIGTANAVFSQDPAIGIYVDDVYLSRSLGANRDFFDIERVEVLRGPQGTLYGSNSPAGAIKIATKKPDLQAGFQATVAATVGSFGERDFNVALNLPIRQDEIAARLVLMSAKNDGNQTSLTDGSKANANDSLGARGHLLAKINKDWDVLLSADITRARTIPTAAVSYWSANGVDLFTTPGFDKRNFYSDMKNRYDNLDNQGVSANLHGLLWGSDFRSITAYRDLEESLNQDVDGTPLRRFDAHQRLKNTQFTQEFNLGGQRGDLNWLVGAYFIREKNDFLWHVNFLQYLPVSVQTGAGLLPGFQLYDQVKDSSAIFTQETLKLSDRATLTGGLRWTRETKDFHVVGYSQTVYSDVGTPQGTPIPGFDIQRSKTWSAPQWRAALDYKLTNDALGFVSATHGYRGGGYNGGARSIAEASAPPFNPEYVTTYEIGAKTEWLNRTLRVNATYFDSKYKDEQVAFLNTGGAFGTSTVDATIKGWEFETLWKATKSLTLFANLGTLDGSTNSTATMFAPNPKQQYTVGFDFAQPAGGLVWSVGGNYFHTAQSDGAATHDPLRVLPAHSNLGGRIGVAGGGGKWKLELIGNNLKNDYWPMFGFNIPPLQTQVRYPNDPRTVNLKLTLNY
ncbi:MAG: TonB-dependent receptor [Proteobacteria bacterium]|nr:TonB-dependent receptor [Pseudomonadota bacterium]